MRDYQARLMIGYVRKQYLYNRLKDVLLSIESTPVVQDENAAYKLGLQFGQTDTLRQIIDLLEEMPQDDPNAKAKYPCILGRPDTWPPD